MNLRRAAVLMVLTVGLAGCGPKPGEGGGGGGTAAGKLDGTWTVTRVELPPSQPPPTAEELSKIAIIVQGNRITARRQGDGEPMYAVFEVDESANPKAITFTQSDDKWDTGPMKRMTYYSVKQGSPAPPPEEKMEPRPKLKALISFDGDTAKMAISPHPEAPMPTEFAPKEPAKKWSDKDATPVETTGVMVVHFTRVKETPEWVSQPVTPTPTTRPRTYPTMATTNKK